MNDGRRDRWTDDVVCENLSMPHSPRVHPDFPGRVWLLNAGTGFFGFADLSTGAFTEVAFIPGFARGMAFVGRYAVVGVSAARENRTFQGRPLDENLKSRDAEPRCALHIINLDTGAADAAQGDIGPEADASEIGVLLIERQSTSDRDQYGAENQTASRRRVGSHDCGSGESADRPPAEISGMAAATRSQTSSGRTGARGSDRLSASCR